MKDANGFYVHVTVPGPAGSSVTHLRFERDLSEAEETWRSMLRVTNQEPTFVAV